MEEVQFRNVTLSVWDLGDRSKLRPLWKHYFEKGHERQARHTSDLA